MPTTINLFFIRKPSHASRSYLRELLLIPVMNSKSGFRIHFTIYTGLRRNWEIPTVRAAAVVYFCCIIQREHLLSINIKDILGHDRTANRTHSNSITENFATTREVRTIGNRDFIFTSTPLVPTNSISIILNVQMPFRFITNRPANRKREKTTFGLRPYSIMPQLSEGPLSTLRSSLLRT
jgi:hypothetical protein